MNEQAPLPNGVAAKAELKCIARTATLLLRGRVRLLEDEVGRRVDFADGTSARVYRHTALAGVEPEEPCVLLVKFRLRLVRGRWHTAFRWESLLNTPLFVGFPGFVSKLWLAHDQNNIYRGIYDWDGPEHAEHYARSLWRVLAIGCEPGSIRYYVVPGLRRNQFLAEPPAAGTSSQPGQEPAWWLPLRES